MVVSECGGYFLEMLEMLSLAVPRGWVRAGSQFSQVGFKVISDRHQASFRDSLHDGTQDD
jgi:hypothetical protein